MVQGKFGNELAAQLGQPWPWLLPLMLRMQMPVLDPTFKPQLDLVCCVPEASSPQDVILRKLQCWFQTGMALGAVDMGTVVRYTSTSSTTDTPLSQLQHCYFM